MYVCLCNGYTDRQLREAAQSDTPESVARVYHRLGNLPQCGRCVTFAREILDQARSTAAAAGSSASATLAAPVYAAE